MNTQPRSKSYGLPTMLIASMLVPSVAFGAGAGIVVPPRVVVVFDSSSSMALTPDGAAIINIDSTGGDYSVANPAGPCTSKFCIAKKVMSSVLPSFSTDTRIGLAHYYQFITKYENPNTQETRCYYDAMHKAGVTRTFSSVNDYGASASVVPDSLQGVCVSNAAHTYTVTKTGSMTTGTFRCGDFEYRPMDMTRDYGATPPTGGPNLVFSTTGSNHCANNTPYPTRTLAPQEWNTATSNPTNLTNPSTPHVRQAVGTAAAATCPVPVPVVAGAPSGAPSQTISSYVSGTADGEWEGMGGSDSECTPTAPCHLYSVSMTPDQRPDRNTWVQLYQTSDFTPANPYMPFVSETHSNAGTMYTNNDSVNGYVGPTAACIGALGVETTYNTGLYSWGTFGFPSPTSGLYNGYPFGFTESTPGGNNPVCDMAHPCRVRLENSRTVSVAQPWITVYDQSPAAGVAGSVIPVGSTPRGGGSDGPYYTAPGGCMNIGHGMPMPPFVGGSGPAGCNGTPNFTCALNLQNANATISSTCTTLITRYNGTTPAPCNSPTGPIAYTPAVPSVVLHTSNLPPGSSCASLGSVGGFMNSGAHGCPAPGGQQCLIQGNAQSVGAAVTSAAQNRLVPIPPGFGGVATPTNQGMPTKDTDPSRRQQISVSCPAAGSVIGSTDATICGPDGAPCDVRSLGPQPDGKAGETQLYTCMYQPLRFTWTSNSVNCNLAYPVQQFSAPGSVQVCQYSRPYWNYEPPPVTQFECQYRADYSRHNFVSVGQQFCNYYRMRTVYEYSTYLYNYSYLTKGGELISYRNGGGWDPGSIHEVVAMASNKLCNSGSYNDATGFPGGDCPPTIDNCKGNNTYCKIRWGRPRTNPAGGSDRYQWALLRDSQWCMAADQAPAADGPIAAPAPSTLVSTRFEQALSPGVLTTACLQNGNPAAFEYRLISDWYQPGTQNASTPAQLATALHTVPTWGTYFPPSSISGPWIFGTPATSNQGYKESGLSFNADGGFQPSQIFVGVGADLPAPPVTPIVDALDKCELPSGNTGDGGSNVDPNTLAWAHKGICMAHDNYQNAAGKADFTPLYGSLKNAKEYIDHLRATDDPAKQACRKYYVVLATDGKEDTPVNWSASDLNNAVDDLCVSKTADGKCTGTSTYVVAFGSGAAAALPVMDDMAFHGGTVKAYPSTDQAALELALKDVFANITAGEFSRSKPALSTDGTRLYATSFTKCGASLAVGLKGCVKADGVTPDPKQNGAWKGFLDAYALAPAGGAPIQVWEMSGKMNSPFQGVRNILATPACATPPCAGQDFSTSNAPLLTTLTAASPTAAQLPPAAMVDWLHNASLAEPFYYDHTGPIPADLAIRQSRVGDIQHSAPVVVGKSVFGADWGGDTIAQQQEYRNFQISVQNRPVRILVGSNDGVLHGLVERDPSCGSGPEDAGTCPNGREAWAWVPGDFVNSTGNGFYNQLLGHRMGVDGTTVVSDICGNSSGIATNCLQADWKTVAIMSLREGGASLTGLKLDNAGGPPQFLWEYNNTSDPRLGQTWSMPVVARVSVGGNDHFAAVFGGGRNMVPNGAVPMGANVGESMYVLDAYTGQPLAPTFFTPAGAEMASRPSLFRRPLKPYLDTVVMGSSDGKLYTMRFADTAGNQNGNVASAWAPRGFFDPTLAADRFDINGQVTPVKTVERTPPWEAPVAITDPVTYSLSTNANACGNATLCPAGPVALPLPTAPPIYNRPKVTATGTGISGDYFVGTGDAVAIELASTSIQTNYFYALRDGNAQGAAHDGRPIFVVRMPHAYEQIVSEPALISGAVIVASYVPPQNAGCGNEGDTILYAFDPNTGDLTPALLDPYAPSASGDGGFSSPDGGFPPGGGNQVPVRRFPGVGIPSDLLVVDGNAYFNTSAGGLQQSGVKPKPNIGDIRSFRKVR